MNNKHYIILIITIVSPNIIMEQLLKLPQIRISILEKTISLSKNSYKIQQTLKQQGYLQNDKFKPQSKVPSALIYGTKPFYLTSRQGKIQEGCHCHFLKCQCKKQACLSQMQQKKFTFLRKQKRSDILLTKLKTQFSQPLEENSNFNATKRFASTYRKIKSHRKSSSLSPISRQKINFNIQQKIGLIYSKIQNQVIRKIFNKFNINKQNYGNNIRKQILDFLFQKYGKKWKNRDVQQKLTMQQIDKILQEVQKWLKQKQAKKKSTPKSKPPKRKQPESTNQPPKQQAQCHVYSPQQKKQFALLLKLIANPNSPLLQQELISELIEADLQKFNAKLEKFQQLLKQYSEKGEEQIRNNILLVLQKIKEKICQNQAIADDGDREKKQKISKINKILRFNLKQNKKCYQYQQKQQKKSIPPQTISSDTNANGLFQRSKKTLKSIKKSQKSLRSLSPFQSDENFQFSSYQNQGSLNFDNKDLGTKRTISQISLAEVLEVNSNFFNSEQGTQYSIRKMSNSKIRASRSSNLLKKQDRINQFQNKAIPTTQAENLSQQNIPQQLANKLQQAALRNIKKHRTERRPAFQQYPSSTSISGTNLNIFNPDIPVPSQYRQQINSGNICAQSIFKLEKEELEKYNRNMARIQQEKILQFMEQKQNKDKISIGATRLKDNNLDKFIIDRGDSLLIKKKKIRKLREVIGNGANGHPNRKQILSQLLAYIDIYQTECNLIMRRNRNTKFKQSVDDQWQSQKSYGELIIPRNQILHQLKFIDLNHDYCYGEQQEKEMQFRVRGKGLEAWAESEYDQLGEFYANQKKNKPYHFNNSGRRNGNVIEGFEKVGEWELGQKDMPQLGYQQYNNMYFIESDTKEQDKSQNETNIQIKSSSKNETGRTKTNMFKKRFHTMVSEQIKDNIKQRKQGFKKRTLLSLESQNRHKFNSQDSTTIIGSLIESQQNRRQKRSNTKKSNKFLLTENTVIYNS